MPDNFSFYPRIGIYDKQKHKFCCLNDVFYHPYKNLNTVTVGQMIYRDIDY